MKKNNLFMVLFVLATAMFYACGSDDSGSNDNGNTDDNPGIIDDDPATDDNNQGGTNLMIGEWKAVTLYWGEGANEQDADFLTTTNGCATDYLTIKAAGVADLTENKKNTENECADVVTTGSWTNEEITIPGEANPREIISVDETTLKLQYHQPEINLLIRVEYSRESN